jgi:RNA polymerase sigma-70 factor (ECF subfamily)
MSLPPEQLDRALAGDPAAVRAVVSALTPVIHARCGKVLLRRGGAKGRDPRQELEDLGQEVLALLFRDDGRILRTWRPDGGLSLVNYVGLVAEREAGHILKSGRRTPWALDPTEETEIERAAGTTDSPEAATSSREIFDQVVARLAEEIHPKAMELFRLLIVEDLAADEVARVSGLSVQAVYTWRSRLLKRTRALLEEIGRATPPEQRAAAPIPEERSEP